MQLAAFLDKLDYSDSPNFLRRGSREFERAPNMGHIFRAAAGKDCQLEGVYTLRPPQDASEERVSNAPLVPVVYVCTAADEATADEIHRLVWNQDIVPFLLVHTRMGIRLYSGFERSPQGKSVTGLLEPLVQFNEVQRRLAAFSADKIDSGEIWQQWGARIKPDARVYWSLLESLKELAAKLREEHGLSKRTIHPLIGKYVYLHYLKDRGFLSPRRLEDWQIDQKSVFGRTATFAGLRSICAKLDHFLNGRVFPINFSGKYAPTEEHIQRVAAAFAGDVFEGGWQFHLPFDAYSFTYIPIETLSMIYEQFLHTSDGGENTLSAKSTDEHTEGRKAGAYYTPIPVVNFMLAELDEHRRLQRGVRVWDPSCGSGAFLVQCYRKLIERTFQPRTKKPTPSELAVLMRRHIFGVDTDEDACSVTEFSLYLTLLDYVQPKDLIDHPRFRLPTLRGRNIFCQDFFNTKPFPKSRFHWIAGNPPWKQLKAEKVETRDERAMKWMLSNGSKYPVGKYSLSQAFAWRCQEFLHREGVCALLLPATTLFEDPSQEFRRKFFCRHRIHSVANFSNLATILFAGRVHVPATALFFGLRDRAAVPDDLEKTTVFSPFVANQEAIRPSKAGTANEAWSLVVNCDDVREITYDKLASGSGLPWKLAMWGSVLDEKLITRIQSKWPLLGDLEAKWSPKSQTFKSANSVQILAIAEGPQLREQGGPGLEKVESVKDAKVADVKLFERVRRIFSFDSFGLPKNKRCYLRTRGGKKGLTVCYPPHIIVSAGRNFAVYDDNLTVVPPRKIGITSLKKDSLLLKALSLYLSSDFVFYHQFLISPEFGVKRPQATLNALRQLPMPLLNASETELKKWGDLYERLSRTHPRTLNTDNESGVEVEDDFAADGQEEMIEELNGLVSAVLKLDEVERALVRDFIDVRFALDEGRSGNRAMRAARDAELIAYAGWLCRELDAQMDEENPYWHAVNILYDDRSGFIEIKRRKQPFSDPVRVLRAGTTDAGLLDRTRRTLRQNVDQWVYFDRSLRIFRPNGIYIFKPIHRLYWTRSRAILDAADVQFQGK